MNRLVGYLSLVLSVALIASFNASAKDLGVIGKTYPIIERDIIDVMKERLKKKVDSGELDAIHKGLVDRSKDYVRRPPGVALPRAQEYRGIEISPMYTLDKDITDADGKVIFKAGTKVNPLKIYPLTKTLCFIDGDDPAQVSWLETYCAHDSDNKLILVNGDLLTITKKLGMRLYYDQYGRLVDRFGIKAVPAVIRQSGEVLYVEEFPVK